MDRSKATLDLSIFCLERAKMGLGFEEFPLAVRAAPQGDLWKCLIISMLGMSIDVRDARLVFRTFLSTAVDSLFLSIITADRKSKV